MKKGYDEQKSGGGVSTEIKVIYKRYVWANTGMLLLPFDSKIFWKILVWSDFFQWWQQSSFLLD